MRIDKPIGKAQQTQAAVFENPSPTNVKWLDVLSMLEAFELAYRIIDERVNVLIPGGPSMIYTLQYKSGSCLRASDVDAVRHLLIMSGLDPRD